MTITTSVKPDRPRAVRALSTPCLLLDRTKMRANIRRMSDRIGALGCVLRPHVKTQKSIDVTREIVAGGNVAGLTVSTLKEARYFFENGFNDIMYAVGITPNKLDEVAELIRAGCTISIILDSVDMARQVAAEGERLGIRFRVLIELDTDGHRSGADPRSDQVVAIGDALDRRAGSELIGVITHAGESYACRTPECLLSMARQERDLAVAAAKRLRSAGLPCPVVSIGSTPTCLAYDDLTGITEVRAGVYVFQDLVMAAIGVCKPDEIAISVLASVIGHQPEKGWAITDAGWMALSRDPGVEDVRNGYGRIAHLEGGLMGDLIVGRANQEHGVITSSSGSGDPSDLPLGSMVRILPNHACSTAAQFDRYLVIDRGVIVATWPRINGW